MGLRLNYSDGQTPLDDDEKEGLLIQTITTRGELDEFEQKNIEEALFWLIRKPLKAESILTAKFCCLVHKKMYGSVWEWAGKFRLTNKNLGVDKWQIPTALRDLCEDASYWILNNTYGPDEIAIRFKHRIVSIHCFPNGNGRHSRLMADILISKIFKLPVFSWGSNEAGHEDQSRANYLKALREADKGKLDALILFCPFLTARWLSSFSL